MRLILIAWALAAFSLFALSRSTPVVFQGQIIALQVSFGPVDEEPLRTFLPVTTPTPEVNNSTKYFHEPGSTDLLGHYDARFFQGETVSYEERTDTLHHMIRAYLSILHDLNVETWIAHGTLLGWWWNSQILPWDWDLDVQVSSQALAYLGEFLNHTTHIYKSGRIERQYFLDVNPHYRERTRGDGENIIDARWIDVRNGLFIDITGISEMEQSDRPDVWACKNEHQYNASDIWPLRESSFEGVRALVPHAPKKVLTEEYEEKALELLEYEGHRWNPQIQRWILDPTVPVSEHSEPEADLSPTPSVSELESVSAQS